MRDEQVMDGFAAALLRWYDTHARAMPWRISPADRAAGSCADPYRVWLSEVMLQQTTVAAVKDYFHRFTDRWPDVSALAAAEDGAVMAEWAGLGYYARARNLLKCARAVARDHDRRFPETEEGLRALPGVGPYTAAAVAAIAFDRPAVVVDGNVERVIARLFAVAAPLPGAKPALRRHAATLTPQTRPGDYAQAMMDLGATVCTPRNPSCGSCPVAGFCSACAGGEPARYPVKTKKPKAPDRQGVVWVARRPDGAMLLERRGERAMLGGMLGFPGTDWDHNGSGSDTPPLAADWAEIGAVTHVFSHFRLTLTVMRADVPQGADPLRGHFVPADGFRPGDLPGLMRKVAALATAGTGP